MRPQEILEPLRTLGFSTVLLVVMFGYLLDVRIGVTRRPRPTLLLMLGFAFFLWALVTIAASEPETLPENLLYFAGLAAMFFTLSQGLQSLRAFWVAARILLVVTLFLAAVAIHQGMSPKICMIDQPQISTTPTTAVEGAEVRLCAARADCVDGGIPGVDYSCEHAGLFGTFSDGGRVRYRGIFQDPNDLAWVMSLSLPLAFGWFSERKSAGRPLLSRLLPVAALVLCIACNVMTRSRSGQILAGGHPRRLLRPQVWLAGPRGRRNAGAPGLAARGALGRGVHPGAARVLGGGAVAVAGASASASAPSSSRSTTT